ncbi:MAG TPA: glycosyltransferase, partial [Candidatus Saccharimonadales bacterium]|nr:glycosyltransferase [Candidatus Saccharimonadales bacterium]
QQFVIEPELPEHPGTKRVLSWRNPAGWGRWGRRLRAFDKIILVWWVPTIQGPVYLGMLGALGRKRPPVTVICHNVLPHEPRPGDRKLARAVLSRCEEVIVHSPAQAELATELTNKPVRTLSLPLPHLKEIRKAGKKEVSGRLLFFGFVRPYKGVDVLLQALAAGPPDVKLTVAGEIWGNPQEYMTLIEELGLQKRVTLRNGYVPANELAELIAQADGVVLPYKTGTASWNVRMANLYGTPVIATKVGSHATQIRHDIDGLLCEPDNAASLTEAIRNFYTPGTPEKLRRNVPEVLADREWRQYVGAVTTA